jgi:hypothetical protein
MIFLFCSRCLVLSLDERAENSVVEQPSLLFAAWPTFFLGHCSPGLGSGLLGLVFEMAVDSLYAAAQRLFSLNCRTISFALFLFTTFKV